MCNIQPVPTSCIWIKYLITRRLFCFFFCSFPINSHGTLQSPLSSDLRSICKCWLCNGQATDEIALTKMSTDRHNWIVTCKQEPPSFDLISASHLGLSLIWLTFFKLIKKKKTHCLFKKHCWCQTKRLIFQVNIKVRSVKWYTFCVIIGKIMFNQRKYSFSSL